jgi:hypothetical protein
MADKPRLAIQLEELLAAFAAKGVRFALIGGLALAPHKVIRATQDIDFLLDAARIDEVHQALLALGYRCLHRSADAGNYQRGDERVDFIYAHRPAAMALLAEATPLDTEFGRLHVVSAKGLTNEPTEDPLKALFDLMVVVEALCPTWPQRPTFEGSNHFLL